MAAAAAAMGAAAASAFPSGLSEARLQSLVEDAAHATLAQDAGDEDVYSDDDDSDHSSGAGADVGYIPASSAATTATSAMVGLIDKLEEKLDELFENPTTSFLIHTFSITDPSRPPASPFVPGSADEAPATAHHPESMRISDADTNKVYRWVARLFRIMGVARVAGPGSAPHNTLSSWIFSHQAEVKDCIATSVCLCGHPDIGRTRALRRQEADAVQRFLNELQPIFDILARQLAEEERLEQT